MSKNLRDSIMEIKCWRQELQTEKQALRRAGTGTRLTLVGRVAAALSGSFLHGSGAKAVRARSVALECSLAKDRRSFLFHQQKDGLAARFELASWFGRHVVKSPATGVEKNTFKIAKKRRTGSQILRKDKRALSVSPYRQEAYRNS